MPIHRSVVFTNHAWQRLGDRTITADMVVETITSPDKTFPQNGSTKFIRTLHGRKVHVVAERNPQTKQWVVISTWVRGEEDKVPLVWQLLTLPFKGLWWILQKVVQLLFKTR